MTGQCWVFFSLLALLLTRGMAYAGPRRPAPAARRPALPSVTALRLEPSGATLVGPRARQRFLATAILADGSERDVTAAARWSSLTPERLRMDPGGTGIPVADGNARVRASYAGRSADVEIAVRGAREAAPVRFNTEVIPTLTRAGCNQGACHGAQFGKGGFKLSLLGYDPEADYVALVKQAAGRRVRQFDPGQSLLLLKPTTAIPHGGGLRFRPGSEPYRLLLDWIRDGAPGPDPKEPACASLTLLPVQSTLSPGDHQRLVAMASFSDGTTRDVTSQTRLDALNDSLATVGEDSAAAVGRGETGVMARYLGRAAVTRLAMPYRRVDPYPDVPHPTPLDELAVAKWKRMGLVPSPLCTDEEFVRRVMLDAIGTLPTPEEARAFVASTDPDRRAKLIDQVLARPEYVDYWSLKWGDLLRNNRDALGDKGMWSFYNWIRACMRENRPVDAMVRDLVTAQGSTFTNGPANFYRVARSPADLAETTCQVFLGMRLQCARCHHHPYERWSQDDYWSMAAFFARVGLKGSDEFGLFGGEQIVRLSPGGEVTQPRSGKVMAPRPPGGDPPDPKAPEATADRRRVLADWLTSKANLAFARNIANRFWGYLMGRGIVDPVDDQRVTNPPSNPELLDALASDFAAHGFDQKRLLREIMNTRVYQLSSKTTALNAEDERFFSHYLVKRLPAEVLFDAIDAATGTTDKFAQLPKGTRAIALPDPKVDSYFLDTFGRPQRQISCECERTGEPNISQALDLMNSDFIQAKVSSPQGRLSQLLSSKKSDDEIVETLYLATFSRSPRPDELARVKAAIHRPAGPRPKPQDLAAALNLELDLPVPRREDLARLEALVPRPPPRKEAFEDLLWALLNSKEFLFGH